MQVKYDNTSRLKVKGWKIYTMKRNAYHENSKKARMDILLSDKIDFKAKKSARDIVGHYILVKESSQQQDIAFLNL